MNNVCPESSYQLKVQKIVLPVWYMRVSMVITTNRRTGTTSREPMISDVFISSSAVIT